MKRLIIYLIASLVLLLAATLLSQYAFPAADHQPYGKMIRIQEDQLVNSLLVERDQTN